MEEGGKSANDINEWTTLQTIPPTYLEERRRLSTSVANFANDFERFARLFAVDGIHDSPGGRAFPTQKRIEASPLTVPVLEKGMEKSLPLTSVPFTIPVYEVKFPAGTVLGLSSETQAKNVRISYRFSGDTTWKPFLSSMTQEFECDADKSISFLVLSTDDSDTVTADLKITKISDKQCHCKRQEPDDSSCGSCVVGNWTLDITATSASQRQNVKVNGRSHIYQDLLHGTQVMSIAAKNASAKVHDVRIAVDDFGYTLIVEQLGEVISRTPTTSTGYVNATIRLEDVDIEWIPESTAMVMKDTGGEGTITWIKDDRMGTVVTNPLTGFGRSAAFLWYNCTAGSLVYRERVDGMMFYFFYDRM